MNLLGSIGGYLSVGSTNWAIRRRIVIATIIFCFGMIIYASEWMRIETAKDIIRECFLLLTFVIGYYVFGAVADDHLKRKSGVQVDDEKPVRRVESPGEEKDAKPLREHR